MRRRSRSTKLANARHNRATSRHETPQRNVRQHDTTRNAPRHVDGRSHGVQSSTSNREKRHTRSRDGLIKTFAHEGLLSKFDDLRQLSLRDAGRVLLRETKSLLPLLEIVETKGEKADAPDLVEDVWRAVARLIQTGDLPPYKMSQSSIDFSQTSCDLKVPKNDNIDFFRHKSPLSDFERPLKKQRFQTPSEYKPSSWRSITLARAVQMSEECSLRVSNQLQRASSIRANPEIADGASSVPLLSLSSPSLNYSMASSVIDLSPVTAAILSCKNKHVVEFMSRQKSWIIKGPTDGNQTIEIRPITDQATLVHLFQFIRNLEVNRKCLTGKSKSGIEKPKAAIFQCNSCGRYFSSSAEKIAHLEQHLKMKAEKNISVNNPTPSRRDFYSSSLPLSQFSTIPCKELLMMSVGTYTPSLSSSDAVVATLLEIGQPLLSHSDILAMLTKEKEIDSNESKSITKSDARIGEGLDWITRIDDRVKIALSAREAFMMTEHCLGTDAYLPYIAYEEFELELLQVCKACCICMERVQGNDKKTLTDGAVISVPQWLDDAAACRDITIVQPRINDDIVSIPGPAELAQKPIQSAEKTDTGILPRGIHVVHREGCCRFNRIQQRYESFAVSCVTQTDVQTPKFPIFKRRKRF